MKRVQRKRAKGFRLPPNTVSVTRPGIFGNPFRVTPERTAEQSVAMFRAWLLNGENGIAEHRAEVLSRLDELRGKNLACYCPPDQPCHADVLLEIANRQKTAQ